MVKRETNMVPTTKAVARWVKDCIDVQTAAVKGDFVGLNRAGQDASLAWWEIWGFTPDGLVAIAGMITESIKDSIRLHETGEHHHTPV